MELGWPTKGQVEQACGFCPWLAAGLLSKGSLAFRSHLDGPVPLQVRTQASVLRQISVLLGRLCGQCPHHYMHTAYTPACQACSEASPFFLTDSAYKQKAGFAFLG